MMRLYFILLALILAAATVEAKTCYCSIEGGRGVYRCACPVSKDIRDRADSIDTSGEPVYSPSQMAANDKFAKMRASIRDMLASL